MKHDRCENKKNIVNLTLNTTQHDESRSHISLFLTPPFATNNLVLTNPASILQICWASDSYSKHLHKNLHNLHKFAYMKYFVTVCISINCRPPHDADTRRHGRPCREENKPILMSFDDFLPDKMSK